MKNWPDAKRIIFEDLIFYSALLLMTLGWDYIVNAFYLLNANPELVHPYNFGSAQIFSTALSFIQILRRGDEWKYYA